MSIKKFISMFVLIITPLSCVFAEAKPGPASPAIQGQGDDVGFKPELHILAIDPDGNLLKPVIQQKSWPPENFEEDFKVKLEPLDDQQEAHQLASEAYGNDPEAANMGPEERYLQRINNAIKAKEAKLPNGKSLQVVICIHGGLNFITQAVSRAAHAYWVMEHGHPLCPHEDASIYPIFICYQSDPFSTYWHHLVYNRSGLSYRSTNFQSLTFLTAPLEFIGDLGSGLVNSPSITLKQAFSDWRTVQPEKYPENINYVSMFDEKVENIHKKRNSDKITEDHLSQGKDSQNRGEQIENASRYFGLLPFKAITGILINSFGPAMLMEMNHNIDVMFWKQEQLMPYYRDSRQKQEELVAIANHNRHQIGALSFFLAGLSKLSPPDPVSDVLEEQRGESGPWTPDRFNTLTEKLKQAMNLEAMGPPRIKVTLIGHSMGTIVINKILQEHPEISYDKIVYMAAACTVEDFQFSVLPYMKAHGDSKFYCLCLHPEAELRNIEYSDFVPRGGLLNWINDIFESPADGRHRVYGQFVTAINTSDIIPPALRDRCYFKAFGYGKFLLSDGSSERKPYATGFPHNHGDFQHYDFLSEKKAVESPYDFWTSDFIWYNSDHHQKDPDLDPGKPAYEDAVLKVPATTPH